MWVGVGAEALAMKNGGVWVKECVWHVASYERVVCVAEEGGGVGWVVGSCCEVWEDDYW